jgi:hypothetical protein
MFPPTSVLKKDEVSLILPSSFLKVHSNSIFASSSRSSKWSLISFPGQNPVYSCHRSLRAPLLLKDTLIPLWQEIKEPALTGAYN